MPSSWRACTPVEPACSQPLLQPLEPVQPLLQPLEPMQPRPNGAGLSYVTGDPMVLVI